MINADSRYAQSTVVKLEDESGTIRYTVVPSHQNDFTVTFQSYQVNGSERIDHIAYEFYQNEERWWMIADANPEVMDWSDIEPGTIIRIPNA